MKAFFWILIGLGSLAVLVILGGAVFSSLAGVRGRFDREARELLAREDKAALQRAVPPSESELAALPPAVRRYLAVSGHERQPRTAFLHASYRARMNLNSNWFPIDCEQFNSLAQSTRLWYGRIDILPFLWVEGRHLYANGQAHMLIKFGPISLVDISGPELARADMITFFNDLAIFMPNALADPSISWQTLEEGRIRADFRNAGLQSSAVLSFDQSGMLSNFVCEDRGRLSGQSLVPASWATPLYGWRLRDGRREMVDGTALYLGPSGTEPYIRFEDPDIRLDYNSLPAAPGS